MSLCPIEMPKRPIAFENVLLKDALLHAPAEEEAVLAIVARDALPHDRALRTASRMKAETGVPLAHAPEHRHIVALLETNPVAMIVAHGAALDHGAGAAIQKDAAATAAVQRDVFLLVSLDRQILDARALDIVSADHWERPSPPVHHRSPCSRRLAAG